MAQRLGMYLVESRVAIMNNAYLSYNHIYNIYFIYNICIVCSVMS